MESQRSCLSWTFVLLENFTSVVKGFLVFRGSRVFVELELRLCVLIDLWFKKAEFVCLIEVQG